MLLFRAGKESVAGSTVSGASKKEGVAVMSNTVIDLREAARKDLVDWFKKKIIDPRVSELRQYGFNDNEINKCIDAELRFQFRGLHRFDG